jgi:hypothetical protein
MRCFALFLLSQIFIQTTVHAAEIDCTRVGELSLDIMTVKGPIVRGDAAVFSRMTTDSSRAIVILNSEGGTVADALAIGRETRYRNFATSGPPNNLCASACALIWLAGAEVCRGWLGNRLSRQLH